MHIKNNWVEEAKKSERAKQIELLAKCGRWKLRNQRNREREKLRRVKAAQAHIG